MDQQPSQDQNNKQPETTIEYNPNIYAQQPQPVIPTPVPPLSSYTPVGQNTSIKLNNGMFQRRIGRKNFFIGVLIIFLLLLIPVVLEIIAHYIIMSSANSASSLTLSSSTTDTLPQQNNAGLYLINIAAILMGFVGIILFIPILISLYVRRFHDLNKSGIFIALCLIPFAGIFVYLYLQFAAGTDVSNEYGPQINSNNIFVTLGLKKP